MRILALFLALGCGGKPGPQLTGDFTASLVAPETGAEGYCYGSDGQASGRTHGPFVVKPATATEQGTVQATFEVCGGTIHLTFTAYVLDSLHFFFDGPDMTIDQGAIAADGSLSGKAYGLGADGWAFTATPVPLSPGGKGGPKCTPSVGDCP